VKKPLLIDLDGVLKIGNSPAPGLQIFFDYLKNSGRPAVIISNTTLNHADIVKSFFTRISTPLPVDILTAADATALYVKKHYSKAAVFCTDVVLPIFDGVLDYNYPEVVVMGDLGKNWDFNTLNKIFLFVNGGADLIAMQKNKFWSTPEDGMLLDLGPFVSAIEYATGKKAILIGKPSPLYFEAGMNLLGKSLQDGFYMLGDDLQNDIIGAQNIGGSGILILTGKTKPPLDEKIQIIPDYVTKDLFSVTELLEKLP